MNISKENIVRVIQKKEATTVIRNPNGPWKWPVVAQHMINDSHKVTGRFGMTAANGDPLALAFAINFLDRLYKLGYAVVELEQKGGQQE